MHANSKPMEFAVQKISPNKNFQAGVNRMVVHRSTVTSRFNKKIASGKRKLTRQIGSSVEDIDGLKETRSPDVCGPPVIARKKLRLEPPIACPVPREETTPDLIGTEKTLKESPKKRTFLSRLLNLETEDL